MKRTGFTLIELLVAMTIVAILMGIALVSFQGARKSSRDGKRKADLEQVRSALEMYRADNGGYPVGSLSSGGNILPYMTIPDDPVPGRKYIYSSDGVTYNLCAALEIGGAAVCGLCGDDGDIACNYQRTNP